MQDVQIRFPCLDFHETVSLNLDSVCRTYASCELATFVADSAWRWLTGCWMQGRMWIKRTNSTRRVSMKLWRRRVASGFEVTEKKQLGDACMPVMPVTHTCLFQFFKATSPSGRLCEASPKVFTTLPWRGPPYRDQRFERLSSSYSHVVLGVPKPCVLQHFCICTNKKQNIAICTIFGCFLAFR